MNILGISGSEHDAASALIIDEDIAVACEEERFCRLKHARGIIPIQSARYCIKKAGLDARDIQMCAYFFSPFKYNRELFNFIFKNPDFLLHPKHYNFSSVLRRGEKHKERAKNFLKSIGLESKLEFVDHHMAHASSFYFSGFDSSMILTLDNIGELDSTMMAYGDGTKIKVIRRQQVPHSLGMLYAAITDFLGFEPFLEEGKVMALASYGKPIIDPEEIIEVNEGSFKIKNPFLFRETKSDRAFSKEMVNKYGEPRKREEPITQKHKDIACSLQVAVENTVVSLIEWLHKKTGSRNLCLSGGVALNCSMNGKIARLSFIDNLYIFPAAGDSGTSLGSAVYAYVGQSGKRPAPLFKAGLGTLYTNNEVLHALEESGISYKNIDNPSELACKKLLEEKVICWFNGSSEFGPRALGHRSILALPNSTAVRDFVNREIKHREMWRPLCPSIFGPRSKEYALNSSNGRFMTIAYPVINLSRDRIPGVVHIDNTMRVQAVYPEESHEYTRLLEYIGKETGDPVLLNTSFNCYGEPIVNSPEDAIRSFYNMPINSMIIENYLIEKKL